MQRVCGELARNQTSKHGSEREKARLESTLGDLEKQLRSSSKNAFDENSPGGGQEMEGHISEI